jgi:hypothetical protein
MDQITSDDIAVALQRLIDNRPGVVRRFYQSFTFRSEMSGLPESGPADKALNEILAGLLSSTYDVHNIDFGEDSEHLEPTTAFLGTLLASVRHLQTTHPLTLVLFSKHLSSRNCTIEAALVSLFAAYVRNQEVYPY